jgi:hypothetical protein
VHFKWFECQPVQAFSSLRVLAARHWVYVLGKERNAKNVDSLQIQTTTFHSLRKHQ